MIHSAHDNDAGRIGHGGVDGGQPATIAGPASADPAVCACDPQALAVAEVRYAGGGWLDAEVNVDGAAPVHAKQTPGGYLGGATPGATVTLEPGHGAHAMVEWVAATGGPDPACTIYGPSGADVTLRVTPPGISQTFTVPISVGRNEGLCNLQIHPLAGD